MMSLPDTARHYPYTFAAWQSLLEEDFALTEQEVKRSLRLVRYGGVVITVTVFVTLLAFAVVTGSAIGGATGTSLTGNTINSLLPYILGLTVMAAVLSIILFFAYRAYLMGRVQRA